MFDPTLHLFIDDYHVRNLFGMERVFFTPEKRLVPVLVDIEGRHACWASVVHEPDGRWRMWYQSVAQVGAHEQATAGVWGRGADYGFFPARLEGAIPETQTSMISYAESRDGVHWELPELRLVKWRGSRRNNIVLDGSRAAAQTRGALTNMDSVSVLRDESAPAEELYKLICHWETVHVWDNEVSGLNRPAEDMARFWAARAKYLATSRDGIHWNAKLERVKECAGGGDYCGVTRDRRHGRWWFNDRAPVGLPGLGFRSAGLCTSGDLRRWPDAVRQVIHPGRFEDYGRHYQHHGLTPFNYGDQDLAFLELSVEGCPVANVLLTHRDGERWRRACGETAFLVIGAKGAADDTVVNATRNAPFRLGDRLAVFYNGRHYERDKGLREGGIFLATLRLDGFAGLRVDPATLARHGLPAMVQVHPLRVKRPDMRINIAGHGGSACVALLDESCRPIPGFEAANCLPIEEDAVRAPVRWRERPNAASLLGRRVIVLVTMEAGTLYSLLL